MSAARTSQVDGRFWVSRLVGSFTPLVMQRQSGLSAARVGGLLEQLQSPRDVVLHSQPAQVQEGEVVVALGHALGCCFRVPPGGRQIALRQAVARGEEHAQAQAGHAAALVRGMQEPLEGGLGIARQAQAVELQRAQVIQGVRIAADGRALKPVRRDPKILRQSHAFGVQCSEPFVGGGDALIGGLGQPAGGQLRIARHALALEIELRELVLRFGVAQFGGPLAQDRRRGGIGLGRGR